MNKRMTEKVKAYIEKYNMLQPGDTVVVGVSGGADSVCLLLMLCEAAKEMPLKLLVVHVNHEIREESAEDAAYVEKLCKERNLPFFLVEEDIRAYAEAEKLSEEEAGRKVRYEAFTRILQQQTGKTADGKIEDGKIAIAHNAGDRVETMLFHLFRGTGLAGASGIKPVRDNIIRPLLCISRDEIENYLRERKIPFCIDRTNLEDTYTRNRIRNHILPFAEKEICRGAAAHMWEAADIILETEEYLKHQAEKGYERCVQERGERIVLRGDLLMQEEPLIQKQVILHCLEELTDGRRDITSAHVEAILSLPAKQESKQVSLPYGLVAAKEYSSLILYRKEEKKHTENIPIFVPGVVAVPGLGEIEFSVFEEKDKIFLQKTQILPEKRYTKCFDYDKITRSLVFRTRETGDYLTINENLSKKTLKEYMIAEKIPKSKRGEFYVLAEGSHILWVPGYRISQYYKVTKDTKRILQVQLRGGL